MHLIALDQQELCEIGTVLTGDPGNQRDLVRHRFFSSCAYATFKIHSGGLDAGLASSAAISVRGTVSRAVCGSVGGNIGEKNAAHADAALLQTAQRLVNFGDGMSPVPHHE